MKVNNKTRRQFLAFGFSSKKNNDTFRENENQEVVKMLTKDGRLVEVNKSVLQKAENRKSATANDLMKWINKE